MVGVKKKDKDITKDESKQKEPEEIKDNVKETDVKKTEKDDTGQSVINGSEKSDTRESKLIKEENNPVESNGKDTTEQDNPMPKKVVADKVEEHKGIESTKNVDDAIGATVREIKKSGMKINQARMIDQVSALRVEFTVNSSTSTKQMIEFDDDITPMLIRDMLSSSSGQYDIDTLLTSDDKINFSKIQAVRDAQCYADGSNVMTRYCLNSSGLGLTDQKALASESLLQYAKFGGSNTDATELNKFDSNVFVNMITLAVTSVKVLKGIKLYMVAAEGSDPVSKILNRGKIFNSQRIGVPHLYFSLLTADGTSQPMEYFSQCVRDLVNRFPILPKETDVVEYDRVKISAAVGVNVDQYAAKMNNINFQMMAENRMTNHQIVELIKSYAGSRALVETEKETPEALKFIYKRTNQDKDCFIYHFHTSIDARNTVFKMWENQILNRGVINVVDLEDVLQPSETANSTSSALFPQLMGLFPKLTQEKIVQLIIADAHSSYFNFKMDPITISRGPLCIIQGLNLTMLAVMFPKLWVNVAGTAGFLLHSILTTLFPVAMTKYVNVFGAISRLTPAGYVKASEINMELEQSERLQGYVHSILVFRPNDKELGNLFDLINTNNMEVIEVNNQYAYYMDEVHTRYLPAQRSGQRRTETALSRTFQALIATWGEMFNVISNKKKLGGTGSTDVTMIVTWLGMMMEQAVYTGSVFSDTIAYLEYEMLVGHTVPYQFYDVTRRYRLQGTWALFSGEKDKTYRSPAKMEMTRFDINPMLCGSMFLLVEDWKNRVAIGTTTEQREKQAVNFKTIAPWNEGEIITIMEDIYTRSRHIGETMGLLIDVLIGKDYTSMITDEYAGMYTATNVDRILTKIAEIMGLSKSEVISSDVAGRILNTDNRFFDVKIVQVDAYDKICSPDNGEFNRILTLVSTYTSQKLAVSYQVVNNALKQHHTGFIIGKISVDDTQVSPPMDIGMYGRRRPLTDATFSLMNIPEKGNVMTMTIDDVTYADPYMLRAHFYFYHDGEKRYPKTQLMFLAQAIEERWILVEMTDVRVIYEIEPLLSRSSITEVKRDQIVAWLSLQKKELLTHLYQYSATAYGLLNYSVGQNTYFQYFFPRSDIPTRILMKNVFASQDRPLNFQAPQGRNWGEGIQLNATTSALPGTTVDKNRTDVGNFFNKVYFYTNAIITDLNLSDYTVTYTEGV